MLSHIMRSFPTELAKKFFSKSHENAATCCVTMHFGCRRSRLFASGGYSVGDALEERHQNEMRDGLPPYAYLADVRLKRANSASRRQSGRHTH